MNTLQTFWLKNNEQIDALNEINYIITSEGDLIINRVELDHQANYTCGAQNIANRRLSEPAVLLVHGTHVHLLIYSRVIDIYNVILSVK